MPNSLRRSSSEPSLRAPSAFHRVVATLTRVRNALPPLPPRGCLRALRPKSTTNPTYNAPTKQRATDTPSTPSPHSAQSLLDDHDLRFSRRDLRLNFLQCGPGDQFTTRAQTRQEILAEIRQAGTFRERRPLRSPTAPVARPTRSENVFNAGMGGPMSPVPRRRPRGGRGRGGASVLPGGIRQPDIHVQRWEHRPSQHSSGSRLTVRDMRQIDPRFTARPAIWVREEALVVNLEGVRAIILNDRMYLFDAENEAVKASLWNIKKRLAYNVEDAFMPFEFRALEGILIHACSLLERDFSAIEPELKSTLINLPLSISNEQLERLHYLEQKLNQYYSRARKINQAIQAVLDEDEDMSEMYLTEKRKNPGLIRNPLDHDEAEMLLETYLQMVDDLTSRAGLLNQAIDDTENLIEIHLDTVQNRVLLVGLIITAITTTLSFATMVTGIFGMNLPLPRGMSQLPTSHYYFWGCLFLTMVVMCIGLTGLMRWCRRAGLHSGRMHSGYRKPAEPADGFQDMDFDYGGAEEEDRKSGDLFGKSRQSGSLLGHSEGRDDFVTLTDQVDNLLDQGSASVDLFTQGTEGALI